MPIVIMLNNFLHDFVVALLFSVFLTMHWIYKKSRSDPEKFDKGFAKYVFIQIKRLSYYLWIFIIIGGVIRTINYREYEWLEAAGRDQIPALMLKHVLLVTFVIYGLIVQIRLNKIFKDEN